MPLHTRTVVESAACDACGAALAADHLFGVDHGVLQSHFGYGSPLDHVGGSTAILCEACWRKVCAVVGLDPSALGRVPEPGAVPVDTVSRPAPGPPWLSLRDALTLVLPLAKGYAAAHPVGNNATFVAQAEAALAALPAPALVAARERLTIFADQWVTHPSGNHNVQRARDIHLVLAALAHAGRAIQ